MIMYFNIISSIGNLKLEALWTNRHNFRSCRLSFLRNMPQTRIIHKKWTVEWKLFVSPLSHFYSSLSLPVADAGKKDRGKVFALRPPSKPRLWKKNISTHPTQMTLNLFFTKLFLSPNSPQTHRFIFTPVAVKNKIGKDAWTVNSLCSV